jgi:hypothetical protein
MNEVRLSANQADILLYIEEPFLLPADYVHAVVKQFDVPWIGAVQTRIVSEYESQRPYPRPSRAGYKKLLRTPVLDGRVAAIRSSCFDDCGQFAVLDGEYLWSDLSWRLMFLPVVLHMTRAITAVSLRAYSTKSFWQVTHSEASGCAQFLLRWRSVLLSRLRRIVGAKLRMYQLELLDLRNHPLSFSYYSFLFLWLHRLVTGAMIMFYCIWWYLRVARNMIVRYQIESLYPWAFFYSDDHATYNGRISIRELQFLDSPQLTFIHNLFMTKSLHSASENMDEDLMSAHHLTVTQLQAELVLRDILVSEKSYL